MKIPNPKANYEDRVWVLNYRCKPPKWEEGELREASYSGSHGSWSWQYTVFINRGKKFFLYVGDSGINKA